MAGTAALGIAATYRDAFGETRRVPLAVRRAVADAMGDGDEAATPADAVLVARPGDPLPAPTGLVAEDGTDLGRVPAVPRDLPYGYHRLDGDRLLIVAPEACPAPRGRGWGWAVQLATTRSTRSWGIGDLADLRALAAWSADAGAGFLAASPIWAPNPAPDPEPSPYYPSTRRYRSPLAIAVEAVPGAEAAGAPLAELAARGRALNASATVDRRAVGALKLAALEAIWAASPARRGADAAFVAWRAAAGPGLEAWATFATISERHGPGWRSWPEELRRPRGAAVERFAAAHAERLAFHAWLQHLLERQLAETAAVLPLVNDLPVGVDPGGFDAWDWQDVLAIGATVGAPPDRFNTAGQDWGLPPFAPHRLRARGHRPFVETVRAALGHAGGLRIDHVLGLFRLWWVPEGNAPDAGAYVRYPFDELLAVLAVESHRAGAFVVGEDLGTVPRGVRPRLARAGVLGTRLLYFEPKPPSSWPPGSLAAVTTHDLPTIAGTWSGADLADQEAAGQAPDAAGLELLRARLRRATDLGPEAAVDDVILAAYRSVAAAPPALAVATLEDALRVRERPNLPGTVAPARANWSVALPSPIESLVDDPFVARLTRALAR